MSTSLPFAHLHTHTIHSLKDGVSDPKHIFEKAARTGIKAVAFTDHGSCAGIWKGAKYAKQYGVKFIPGCEFYVVPDAVACRGAKWGAGASYHMVVLAADNKGYENLLALFARSYKEGYYYQPRIGLDMLREHNEGLWVTTACLGGFPAKAIKKKESPDLAVSALYEIFGDRLSLEIQLNGEERQLELNNELIRISTETSIPLVAALDSHYVDKSDYYKQDLVFAMQFSRQLDDPDRYKMPFEENSLETPEEVYERFVPKYGAHGRAAINRTIEIADNCNVDVTVESRDYKIPTLDITSNSDYKEYIEWRLNKLAAAKSDQNDE